MIKVPKTASPIDVVDLCKRLSMKKGKTCSESIESHMVAPMNGSDGSSSLGVGSLFAAFAQTMYSGVESMHFLFVFLPSILTRYQMRERGGNIMSSTFKLFFFSEMRFLRCTVSCERLDSSIQRCVTEAMLRHRPYGSNCCAE